MRHTLGKDAIQATEIKLWSAADQLPLFLNAYAYYQANVFGEPCLLMRAGTPEGEAPAVVRKHWEAVSKRFNGNVIYVVAAVSSYNRKRLIEQGVPFLVPGNQLYLPPLGIDLREYFKQRRQPKTSRLSAPAQAVLLREILTQECSGLPAKDLAKMLSYSPMTMSRAAKELTEHQLAVVEKIGRTKPLRFVYAGRSLWEAAQGVLQSPVTKRIQVLVDDHKTSWQDTFSAGYRSGDSALAHYTDLADSGFRQWAITSETWSAAQKSQKLDIRADQSIEDNRYFSADKDAIELELWAYDPGLIAPKNPWVDPLSLWLSFENSTDERINIARQSLLEQVWNTLPW